MDELSGADLALTWVSTRARVKTKKGASFRGKATGLYHNHVMGHYGVVVVAEEYPFEGCAHVYPVAQLELVEPMNEDS